MILLLQTLIYQQGRTQGHGRITRQIAASVCKQKQKTFTLELIFAFALFVEINEGGRKPQMYHPVLMGAQIHLQLTLPYAVYTTCLFKAS